MNDFDDDVDYDHEGLCEAQQDARGQCNCVLCGKELIEINGIWYAWDHYLYENPIPQDYVRLKKDR